jgi:hypothetical protein
MTMRIQERIRAITLRAKKRATVGRLTRLQKKVLREIFGAKA